MGGLAKKIPITFVDLRDRHRGDRRHPAARRASSPRTRSCGSPSPARAAARRCCGRSWPRTALMTAFYMFRLLWLTFFGASRMEPEVEHHVHESPLSMTGVLVVLAVLSAVGGFVALPHFLEPMLPLPESRRGAAPLRDAAGRRRRSRSRFAGLAGAAFFYGGGTRARGAGSRARFARAAPAALRQVLRRRGLRAPDRPAAALDLRPRLPALRRPRAARRHAERPRARSRSARAGALVARADRQPAAATRSSCSPAASPRWPGAWRHV